MQRQNILKKGEVCCVCDQLKGQLYEIADCGHRFCSQCCIAYVESQAHQFSKAKCLQQNCGANLDKSKPIYKYLNKATINRIQKYELFQFLQINSNAKACRGSECIGYFLVTNATGQCIICQSQHCTKCYLKRHQGKCTESNKQQQQQMKKLNYRKCPKCSIWVEKIDGCQYISCKCGIQFCYRCGHQFSKDPCRKQKLWENQSEIRKLMSELQIVIPSTLADISCMALRLFLLLIIIVPFTALYCCIPLFLTVIILTSFILLFSPLVILYPISTIQQFNLKCLAYIMLIIFYPLLGTLFAVIFMIILLLYPCLRARYHHGVYDPLDIGISKMTIWYLKFIVCITKCSI